MPASCACERRGRRVGGSLAGVEAPGREVVKEAVVEGLDLTPISSNASTHAERAVGGPLLPGLGQAARAEQSTSGRSSRPAACMNA